VQPIVAADLGLVRLEREQLLIKEPESSRTLVKVQGRGTTFEFLLDDTCAFDTLQKELRCYLEEKGGRFQGLTVSMNPGRRVLDSREVEGLRRVMEEYKISIGEAGPFGEASGGLSTPSHKGRRQHSPKPPDPGDTLLVRHTCRTGTAIRHAGNVAVLGNVNPGAEVIAGGDVIVMGTLKGLAHAGVDGNQGAVIVALSFQASQLRIANLIAIEPAKGRPKKVLPGPEMAYIHEGVIVVEPYVGTLPKGARTPRTKRLSEVKHWWEGL
jgi:septum site-determining protein MinC